MNVSDITDEELNRHLLYSGFELSDEKVDALVRAELSRRAVKVEKVEPVVRDEAKWFWMANYCKQKGLSPFSVDGWNKAHEAYEAAKPKPASAPLGSCYGCLKFNPPYCTMIGSIAPHDAGGCASKETPKPNPQTTGEGAIAALTLADVPIGAVAVFNSGSEYLVIEKTSLFIYCGHDHFGHDICIKRWYWPQDAVNRLREGK